MAVRVFSCKPPQRHHRQHCPRVPCLRPNIITTTTSGNGALQSTLPAGLLTSITPGSATVATSIAAGTIPTFASVGNTGGTPLLFNVGNTSPSLVTPTPAGGTYTGLQVSQVPFSSRTNAGVSIYATTSASPATTDFTANLVFVPTNTSVAVKNITSVAPTTFAVITGTNVRYDFVFTNVSDSETVAGTYQIRLTTGTTGVAAPPVTTISPSTFDVFATSTTTTTTFVPF